MFTVRLIQHRKRFPSEVVESQFLKIFKAQLHQALRNLLYLITVWGRGWIGWHPEVSSDLHLPVFLWTSVQSLGCSWRNAARNICLFGTHPQEVTPKEKSCDHLLKKEKARIAVLLKLMVMPVVMPVPKYSMISCCLKLLPKKWLSLDLSRSKQVQGSHREIRILKKGSGMWRSLWWKDNVSFPEIMSPIFMTGSGLSFAWAQMEKQPRRWRCARLPSQLCCSPQAAVTLPLVAPFLALWLIIFSAKIQLQQQAPNFLPSHRWATH